MPMLYDNSSNGTAISYDGTGAKSFRTGEHWILAMPKDTGNASIEVVIHLPSMNAFAMKISFPNHLTSSSEYRSKALRFIERGTDLCIPLVSGLDVNSNTTTAAISPPSDNIPAPFYIRETKIGTGAFATVWRVVDSRDGKFFAAKAFAPPKYKKRKREFDSSTWLTTIDNEVEIMQRNVHVRTAFKRRLSTASTQPLTH